MNQTVFFHFHFRFKNYIFANLQKKHKVLIKFEIFNIFRLRIKLRRTKGEIAQMVRAHDS